MCFVDNNLVREADIVYIRPVIIVAFILNRVGIARVGYRITTILVDSCGFGLSMTESHEFDGHRLASVGHVKIVRQ